MMFLFMGAVLLPVLALVIGSVIMPDQRLQK